MNTRRCFKCQGLGHITLDCPNLKIIMLAQQEAVNEEENEKKKEVFLTEDQEEDQDEVVEEADEAEMLAKTKAE